VVKTASNEHYGFVFAVTFIIIFTALVASIPADLQGQGATPNILIPVTPNLLTDFTEAKQFSKVDFTLAIPYFGYYYYDLPTGATTFSCDIIADSFRVGAHTLFVGVWLGGISWTNFISENGTNYGTSISFSDLENDAEDGAVRYTLQYEDSGNSAGGFVFYWNTTTYPDPVDAWDNDELELVHGVGISADVNVANLLLALLFLQLPDVPMLVNILLIGPVWASIIYVLWYIVTTMIPFLSP